MLPLRHLTATLLLLVGLIAAPFSVRAAQSYDNCAGFIDTLPATISTQGVWCLRHDLSTAITIGFAINIDTNNVTIDCNDFKIDGLAAGTGTSALGIGVGSGFFTRLNATVRHCDIRGFYAGVDLSGGGHVVEDNRFDGNTVVGIAVSGNGSVVRRNQVTDTGGTSGNGNGDAFGISTSGTVDILDNTVSGVTPGTDVLNAYGIRTYANHYGSISGNRVRAIRKNSGPFDFYPDYGIYNQDSVRISVDGNHVIGAGKLLDSSSTGLSCPGSFGTAHARDNIVNGFQYGISNCVDDGNVVVLP